MPTSRPLRLDAALTEAAGAMARRCKRTLPRQIEYWAELGRAVEAMLDPASLLAVQEGLARLVVEMAPSNPVSSQEVFADVEEARGTGRLATSEARVRYQASADAPGHLEELHADGRRVVGDFRGGRFVPLESELAEEGPSGGGA